jgi:hypothetical protein
VKPCCCDFRCRPLPLLTRFCPYQQVGLLGNLITEVEWFQSQTFSLQEVPLASRTAPAHAHTHALPYCGQVEEPIVNFLNNLNLKNEDELYKISLAHEPRGS